jgi:hypothetical protein
MYFLDVFVWNQNRACAPSHKKAENSWKRRIQASKFITKHARIGRTYLRWKRIKSRVYMPASTPTRPLHWREPHCEFVAFDFEALDVKIALDFRAFVLQSCTLYTVKKNEALNRRPHFVSRIPLLFRGRCNHYKPIHTRYCIVWQSDLFWIRTEQGSNNKRPEKGSNYKRQDHLSILG